MNFDGDYLVIIFSCEYKQATVALAGPVTVSPMEITGIFISHFSCYRCSNIFYPSHYFEIMAVIDKLLDLVS